MPPAACEGTGECLRYYDRLTRSRYSKQMSRGMTLHSLPPWRPGSGKVTHGFGVVATGPPIRSMTRNSFDNIYRSHRYRSLLVGH